jgi:DNA transformation protein
MATTAKCLAPGSFGAFVLDQLSALEGIEARSMFGGAGFYLDGEFFGILYKEHLYFRVSAETIAGYKKRGMKPFAPFEGRRGESRRYYEVPVDILESAEDLVKWARIAQQAAPLTPERPRRRESGRAGRAVRR